MVCQGLTCTFMPVFLSRGGRGMSHAKIVITILQLLHINIPANGNQFRLPVRSFNLPVLNLIKDCLDTVALPAA